jgi:transposase
VALRSGLKAQVHAVLAKEGVQVPMSDLFGVGGTRLLDELRLGRAYGLRVASLRRLLVVYDREITMLGRQIPSALAGDVGYLAIQAIPGVGPVLAAVFVAEIGNVHRFAGAPQLCSWAGLTPRHHESDTTARRGPITKQGPRLVRWAAVEATQRLPRTSKQAADFHRIADRRGTGVGASPPPASCSPWSTTACVTARCAAWRRGRRCERLGRSPARARVCHDPRPAARSPVD